MNPRLPALARRRAAWLTAVLFCAGAAIAGETRLDQLPQVWRDDFDKPLVLGDLVGHRVILSMAYTQCHRTCPATLIELQRMQQVLDKRGEQASFVIVGYDTDNDDPQSWHEYRQNHRLERENWHFLTGTQQDVRRLAHELGFEFWDYDTHVMHGSRIVFFDSNGLFSGGVSPATGNWAALL